MRKSTIPLAFAIVTAMSLPAHAGKYGCNVFNGSSVKKQCDIEAGASGSGSYCDYDYSASLKGLCYVTKSGSTADRIQCEFGNFTGSIAEVAREAEKADAKIQAEQPGFLAGGVTLGPPATLALGVGYRENTAAPVFQLQCLPK